ncbi:MAG TPA: hypothetical protein DCE41_07620, partial [Cytophagales bacterium]|nr:hypothetical protein [Cytophagales bacterium]
MLENLRPTEAEYRDGIIRARRMLSALDPNHTAWEDRTLNDWLQFVQEFSQMVHYVNERNERQGTWEGLLSPQRDWATAFASDTERQEALAEFRALLVAYTQQQLPETTTADTLEQLSRPHRVLLLIFLKLLDQFKDPFNHLVGRHLQYQMEEILRFRPRPSQADTLGVEVRLEDDAAATMLPKGSLLDAGEDADGNPLQYATEYDTWLHTTQVTGVRSLFMKKTLETLELVHNEELDKSGKDEAFTKLLEFAIGEKGIGTPLAPLPEGIADLYALRDTLAGKLEMKRGDKFADVHWVYLYQHLYMDYATFSELLDIQTRSKDVLSDVHGDEWPLAYGYLELAYLRKQVEDRKLHLTQLYEAQPGQAGYMEMLRYAFGEVQPPADEVELAEYKGVATDPGVLYADLKGGNASDRNLAEKYLSDEWSMEGPDFSRMHEVVMDTKRTPAAWDEAMSLLESAMRKKQRLVATVPQREVVGKLYAFDNPEEQLGTKNTDASHQAWPLFGQENNDYMPTLGFRIRSPLMALSGGRRVLNLYLSLERSTLTEPTLELLEQLGKEETLPIESAVWVNEEMVPPNKLEYTFANQVLGKEIDRWSMQEKDGLLIIGDTDGAVIQSQLGRVVVLDASGVLRIPQEVDKANSIRYEELGVLLQEEFPALDPPLSAGTMAVFPPEQVFANAICLQYHYGLEEPSLFPEDTQAIPELFLTFDPHFTPTNFSWPWSGMLPALRYVKVAQMHLEVTVQDLPLEQGQNDTNTLDPAKPFTPFGDPCNPGNSFYFMHPEMASKPLDQLQLEMDWMQLPDSFTDYYATYPQLKGNPLVGQGEGTTATVRLRFRDGALPLVVDENITLFPGKSDNGYHRLSVPVKDKLAQRYPEYAYPYRSVAATRNLLEASRFFTLEYTGPSFGQSHYEVANL